MLNNNDLHTLSSTSQGSAKSETRSTEAKFTEPTFTKPEMTVKVDGSDHSIEKIIDGSVSLPQRAIMLSFNQFIDFYKSLTSNIESLNSEIAVNINNGIVNPLSNSISNIHTLTSNIGEIEGRLIEQINQIRENMPIFLE